MLSFSWAWRFTVETSFDGQLPQMQTFTATPSETGTSYIRLVIDGRMPNIEEKHCWMKTNSLVDMFQVLSGARDPAFFHEPKLRLFQLKVWLLSDDDDSSSINNSAVLFASIMLRRRIRLDHRDSPEDTPSELIDALFKRKAYRQLYDLAFPYPRTPYSLSLKLLLEDLRSKFRHSREAIDYLNQLTELRLRLRATEGYPFSLNAAQDLRGKLPNGTRRGFARTNLAEVHRARQTREAFLFVARHCDAHLLQFRTKLDQLFKGLRAEVADRERFKKLFGRAFTALEVLKPKGLTAGQLHEWTQVDPIPLDDVIKPFSKAELDEVGFFPTPRRAAETTRAGKR
jgi:hypothetical protein